MRLFKIEILIGGAGRLSKTFQDRNQQNDSLTVEKRIGFTAIRTYSGPQRMFPAADQFIPILSKLLKWIPFYKV